jgi:calcineurin-like phosphoesterase family protein
VKPHVAEEFVVSKVYVIADPHWGHENVINVPVRRDMGFKSGVEHDEHIIANWNRTVTKYDTVLLLGDIGFDRKGYVSQGIVPRLNGRIEVVAGNHDTAEICALFDKVHGVKIVKRAILTHIPIHPQEMYWDINVHGHLHGNRVKKYANSPAAGSLGVPGETDPRYICVSCEHTNYTPVDLHILLETHREIWKGALLPDLPEGRIRRD